MNILVTGAKGFIGKNLIEKLEKNERYVIFKYDIDSTNSELHDYIKKANFVFHLAGINRPLNNSDFIKGNYELTYIILSLLKKYNNRCPIMFSSSIQATLNNNYGMSKKAAEDLIFKHSEEMGSEVYIYRFENVFGKYALPNYNSVVATFSYNIANNIPIVINDPKIKMKLIYIDDVVVELVSIISEKPYIKNGFMKVRPVYKVKLGIIAELLYSFKNKNEKNICNKNVDPLFVKKLYFTYSSYLNYMNCLP